MHRVLLVKASEAGHPNSLEFSLGAWGYATRELFSWELVALDEFRRYFAERNPLFVPTRLRNEHVLNVFPQLSMLCQVDLNGHLAALVVGHILDSGHGFASSTRSDRSHASRMILSSQFRRTRLRVRRFTALHPNLNG